jgi:hypothetical protein
MEMLSQNMGLIFIRIIIALNRSYKMFLSVNMFDFVL